MKEMKSQQQIIKLVSETTQMVKFRHTIELTPEYVEKFNAQIVKDYRIEGNSIKITDRLPYFDAELLSLIYDCEGDIEKINATLKERGLSPIQDFLVLDINYPDDPQPFSLIKDINERLDDDITEADAKMIGEENYFNKNRKYIERRPF